MVQNDVGVFVPCKLELDILVRLTDVRLTEHLSPVIWS